MKKDQVVILEKRGVILISGNDADDFLQNIITNDIKTLHVIISSIIKYPNITPNIGIK